MAISYIDEQLNIGIIYETVGSPVGWDTTIISRDNGFHLSIERQSDSIGRWNIGDRLFSKREFDYLLNFFYNVRGNLIAFKYKDWGDYQATNQIIGNGNGTRTEFQLIKTYGDYPKPIYKPIANTIAIYLDGILQTSGYTINSVGLVTFAIAPLSGVAITANFEFDLVVRFENESLSSRFDAYDPSHPEEALYNVPAIYLIEVLPQEGMTITISGTLVAGNGEGTPIPNYPIQYNDYGGNPSSTYTLDNSSICSTAIGCGVSSPNPTYGVFYQSKLKKDGIVITNFSPAGWYSPPSIISVIPFRAF